MATREMIWDFLRQFYNTKYNFHASIFSIVQSHWLRKGKLNMKASSFRIGNKQTKNFNCLQY